MKSSKLIELLKKQDPEGNTEVCVGNCDIIDVDLLPAYYDGKLQTLQLDEDNWPISGKYHSKGNKIKLITMSISDCIAAAVDRDEEFIVDYSESGALEPYYKEANNKTKKMTLHIKEQVELSNFREWFKEAVLSKFPEYYGNDYVAIDFFLENISAQIPMPADLSQVRIDEKGTKYYTSWLQRRKDQWNRELQITFNGFDYKINRISGISMKPKLVEKLEIEPKLIQKEKQKEITKLTLWQKFQLFVSKFT